MQLAAKIPPEYTWKAAISASVPASVFMDVATAIPLARTDLMIFSSAAEYPVGPPGRVKYDLGHPYFVGLNPM